MEPKGRKEEQVWVNKLISGDKQMLGHFFDLHYRPLCYFAFRLTQNDAEAQDIVSDCFIKLWEKHTDFQTAENIKAFLYINCRNRCLDFLRNLKRRTTAQQEYFNQLEQSEDLILNNVIRAEFMQLLHEEVAVLPPQSREVFKLIYFEGKNTNEIALILNLSPKTVRNYKTIAIEKLKSSFLKKGIKDSMFLSLLLLIYY